MVQLVSCNKGKVKIENLSAVYEKNNLIKVEGSRISLSAKV
jgi:hypothetical protein